MVYLIKEMSCRCRLTPEDRAAREAAKEAARKERCAVCASRKAAKEKPAGGAGLSKVIADNISRTKATMLKTFPPKDRTLSETQQKNFKAMPSANRKLFLETLASLATRYDFEITPNLYFMKYVSDFATDPFPEFQKKLFELTHEFSMTDHAGEIMR